MTKFVQNSDYKIEFKITLQEPNEGTVDALRWVRCHIKNDFIYMSMNSFTMIPPYKILEVYRLYSPSLTMHLYDTRDLLPSLNNKDSYKLDSSSSLGPHCSDFILIDKAENRIYAVIPKNKWRDVIKIRTSLLNVVPNLTILTTKRASRIYVFKHWVLELVDKNPGIQTVNYQLVNVLLQMQYRQSIREKYKVDKYIEFQQDCFSLPETFSTTWDCRFKTQIFCAAVSDPDYLTALIDSEQTHKSIMSILSKSKYSLPKSRS